MAEYKDLANERTKISAQIETSAGLKNMEDIPGAQDFLGAMLSPNNLSCDPNCIGNPEPIISAIKITVSHG